MNTQISLRRTTLETDIVSSFNIYGTGLWHGSTSVSFLDHLLTQFTTYSLVDLKLFCCGDLSNGWHHVVEDVGIVFGLLTSRVWETQCKNRFNSAVVAMDGSLVRLSLDFSGRSRFYWSCESLSNISSVADNFSMARIFFDALVFNCGITAHVDFIKIDDWHHATEALFKSLGICYKNAFNKNDFHNASTKGKQRLIWR
ncbi:Imidazoleglycerol-phosphate dehydratase [Candidatus Hodgkinia cicadicola]|nr:Imidazoleglycerol-phosphate dehydratase [Candidatus Hodgkinia cicadicola]